MRALLRDGRVGRIVAILRAAPRAVMQLVVTQARENTIPRQHLARVGGGTYIHDTVSFRNPENIEIGENVIFGPYNVIWASRYASLVIEDHALLGPHVTIVTANHGVSDLNEPINDQPEIERSVRIGRGVWLGTKSVILSGVTIGEGAVVAAGAIVNRDVAPFEIVGGVPAKRLASRLAPLRS